MTARSTSPAPRRDEGGRALPGGARSSAVSTLADLVRPPEHPRIPPWLRPIARRPGEVQFGLRAGGPIVTGVTEAEAMLLGHLDGHLPLSTSYQLARGAGVPARRWRALLDLVQQLEVLEQPGSAAAHSPVLLDGRGALVHEIAGALQKGGIRSVTHPGASVDTALHSRLGGAPTTPTPHLPGGASSPLPPPGPLEEWQAPPALAIVVGAAALDPRSGDPWWRRGVAHLPVVADGPRAIVGPLVEPSRHGPCLWCVNLHRADRDGSWPALMAQVCGSPGDIVRRDDDPPEVDAILGHLVGGCVALMVRSHLDGTTTTPGVSVDVTVPLPRMDHRRWPIHPQCRKPHLDSRPATTWSSAMTHIVTGSSGGSV